MPSEPSARARVHLAPSKCYWPRRIPAPLGVNPQRTAASQPAGDRGELSISSAPPPPGVPQQGVGGLQSHPGCHGLRAGGGVGKERSPPPRRHGRGCYMTRRGRHWAGTHRGCDSCCGYNREPGEGGRGRLRSLRPAGALRGVPRGTLHHAGAKHPTAPAVARRRACKTTRHPQDPLAP